MGFRLKEVRSGLRNSNENAFNAETSFSLWVSQQLNSSHNFFHLVSMFGHILIILKICILELLSDKEVINPNS